MKNITTYCFDNELKVINPEMEINIHLEAEYQHFLLMPLLLLNAKVYRELISKIFIKIQERFESKKPIKPIIIISSISWLDSSFELEMINSYDERINRFLRSNSNCSFLFNSSAWIQFVEIEYRHDKIDWELTHENYRDAIDHFKRMKKLQIFQKPNAIEYIEYHMRLQKENYLVDNSILTTGSGHSRHISPYLYSNENFLRQKIELNDELDFLFTKEIDGKGDFKIKGVTIRILLIDDKIGNQIECKSKLIKDLLEMKFEPKKKGEKSIRDYVCWRTPINDEDTVKIINSIKCKNCTACQSKDNQNRQNGEFNKSERQEIEIYTAQNLTEAKDFLSNANLRFDLILMDYLLAEKDNYPDEREYATDFWSDGKEKYFEISLSDLSKKVETKKYSKDNLENYQLIKATYDKIKANRGPLKRLWIFPITAFNQTFIDDLRNKGIRLIDYYWYLSRGADPINTPYLFIYSLNMFLQLQLENAFFSIEEILVFVKKTTGKLNDIDGLDDFNAFMGAEYAVFVERYMTRAVTNRDKKAGSLFAEYVWKNFYSKDEFRNLFILVEIIQKFYHCCAFGTGADLDKMINLQRELNMYVHEEFPDLANTLQLDKFYQSIVAIKRQA